MRLREEEFFVRGGNNRGGVINIGRGDRTILTHYHHVAEDLIVGHVRTVPAVVLELVAAFA